MEGTPRFHAHGSKVSQARNQPERTARRYIAQDRTRVVIIIIIIAVVLRKTTLFNGHEPELIITEQELNRQVYGAESS
jgi:hypothetical protein